MMRGDSAGGQLRVTVTCVKPPASVCAVLLRTHVHAVPSSSRGLFSLPPRPSHSPMKPVLLGETHFLSGPSKPLISLAPYKTSDFFGLREAHVPVSAVQACDLIGCPVKSTFSLIPGVTRGLLGECETHFLQWTTLKPVLIGPLQIPCLLSLAVVRPHLHHHTKPTGSWFP